MWSEGGNILYEGTWATYFCSAVEMGDIGRCMTLFSFLLLSDRGQHAVIFSWGGGTEDRGRSGWIESSTQCDCTNKNNKEDMEVERTDLNLFFGLPLLSPVHSPLPYECTLYVGRRSIV